MERLRPVSYTHLNRAVNTKEVEELAEAAENLTIISIETTDEMLSALEDESKNGQADALIPVSYTHLLRAALYNLSIVSLCRIFSYNSPACLFIIVRFFLYCNFFVFTAADNYL